LPIVHGYVSNPLAVGIYTTKCGYGYNPFWLLPIVHGYVYSPLLLVLAIDIYIRVIVDMVITNWLLPIVHGYVLNPLVIS
jgi:hypothetical protein